MLLNHKPNLMEAHFPLNSTSTQLFPTQLNLNFISTKLRLNLTSTSASNQPQPPSQP